MRTNVPINPHFFLNRKIRAFILGLMVTGFLFGFADLLWDRNFERLHVFLFNLCAGGFIIIYHTENHSEPSLLSYLFLGMSLLYALSAFFHLYMSAALLSFSLALLVETVRVRTFSFIPADLFDFKVSVVDKFHHASVLCLSLGLLIATLVLVNSSALHWIQNKNLTLDVFFLGFSFPVSLITMSVMFSFIKRDISPMLRTVKQLFFWIINVGVIIFFIFIIFDLQGAKIAIAFILFLAVVLIFTFFLLLGVNVQQKQFLLSGMIFLVFTGISGIGYIFLGRDPAVYEQWGPVLLSCHAYLSLYGWGLSGLLILVRWNDFPLKLNSWRVILMHWLVIAILAPLGETNLILAITALISFCLFLHFFFEEEDALPISGKTTDT